MNPAKNISLLKMLVSIFLISILTAGGCDVEFGGSGDSSGSGSVVGESIVQGTILNFAEFGEITVTAFQDNFRLDRTTTDEMGNFELKFRASSGSATLQFQSDSFNAERPNIRVVGNSTTILDITLEENPSLITIERWQVFQDTISLLDDTNLNFVESIVEFNIEGNGANCIFATANSIINYQVKSINIVDCREGIRTQSSASITLLADENINISSTQDAILTLDDSSVEIGQTSDPINNTIFIDSENQFGINASGNSAVTINPQNVCSISGGSDAVNEFGTGSVDTSTCTLSL